MADDLHKRGPQDRSRVNVHEDWEVKHWTAHFECTEAQLKAAVKAVGVMVKDVEAYLKKHK
jgi:hypothetical protein